MNRKCSTAYHDWLLEYLRPVLNESDYYLAQLAAERLLVRGLISESVYQVMIKETNAALGRFGDESP